MSKTTFRILIAKWPSLADFAEDLKVPENTAKQMRTRDSIGIEHWKTLIFGARKRRIRGVTWALLAQLKAERATRPLPAKGGAKRETDRRAA